MRRGALVGAIDTRLKVARHPGSAVVLGLRGGRGALLRNADARRLVTTISGDEAAEPSTGIAAWLERRQAKRSAFLVVPDRATGVAAGLRWGLDPQKFRLASAFVPEDAFAPAGGSRKPAWHSAG